MKKKSIKSNLKIVVKILLASLFALTAMFTFFGCKKADNLNEISKNLTNYHLVVDFNQETKSATASCEVVYFNNTNAILREIKFHLYPQYFKKGATHLVVATTKTNNAYPNGMSYTEFEIARIKVNDDDVAIEYSGEYNGILNVKLANSLLPGERIDVLIEYSFILPNCEHRFGYGENTINLANFYPVACVFEQGGFVTNPYNANGDPFFSDIANYDVTINCNKNLVVAGTGVKTEKEEHAITKTVNFFAKAVRDFACVLSEKFEIKTAKAGKVSVDYYFFNDKTPEQSLQAGVDAINTFSKKFGQYPYQNFNIVETDFVYGGMEYPNLVMISSDIENVDDYINVIVHETAHQWWYGMVGNDEYTFPWLDESLTEFSTVLFYDYNKGYNFSHKKMVKSCHDNYALFVSVYTDVLGNLNTSMRAVNEYNTEPEYIYCIYVKGVLMFESLYNLMGEKNFIKALQEYFNANKFKNAKPEDLISAFERVNKADLQGFFSSWIDGKVIIK